MSFSFDMDYTKFGKVQIKIIALGNDHTDAVSQAFNIVENQKQFIKDHKQQLDEDREKYSKVLMEQFTNFVKNKTASSSTVSANQNIGGDAPSEEVNPMSPHIDSIYS